MPPQPPRNKALLRDQPPSSPSKALLEGCPWGLPLNFHDKAAEKKAEQPLWREVHDVAFNTEAYR